MNINNKVYNEALTSVWISITDLFPIILFFDNTLYKNCSFIRESVQRNPIGILAELALKEYEY